VPRIVADLHIHSKFSRATSADMEAVSLNPWAKMKGVDLLGTGDFTHPGYLSYLKKHLVSNGRGLFRLKHDPQSVHFMLTAEVSNMYKDRGKGRRVHTLLFAPGFDEVDKINSMLSGWGKTASDGRPIFGLPVKELAGTVLGVSEACMVIPAHAWTPWFSVFGSESGYDSIEEAFGETAPFIRAIETGLSSDPSMNWRLSCLDPITLISNSDAHSPAKLGREANVFDCDFDYHEIVRILKTKDTVRFLETVEFFPEAGKYHFDGHRACRVRLSPEETQSRAGLCPVCGRPVTVGVMNRVARLADRPESFRPGGAVPFTKLVPLAEIAAGAMGRGVNTKGVAQQVRQLIEKGGNEFRILRDLSPNELSSFVPERIVEGILRVREGRVAIKPGYDGMYGEVSIFDNETDRRRIITTGRTRSH
jgi:uncharacterized protein (TIGR00375 family)